MYSHILLAQVKQNLGNIGDPSVTGGMGPFGNAFSRFAGPAGAVATGEAVAKIFSNTIGVLTTTAGLWFIIQFVVGTYKWITSGGDKQSVESAKNHLTQAVIGLAITVITLILTGIVGSIMGLDILNPQNIIPLLKP